MQPSHVYCSPLILTAHSVISKLPIENTMARGQCVTNKTVKSPFQIQSDRISWLFPIFNTSPPFYCMGHVTM